MEKTSNLKKLFQGELRFDLLWQLMWRSWRTYAVAFGVAAVVSVVIALSLPRYYESEIMLAPEYSSSSSSMGSLGSLASMAGLNLGSSSSDDAIYPKLYPDLMASTDFIVTLFPIKVQTVDGKFKGMYADYMQYYQKEAWWTTLGKKVKKLFAKNKTEERASQHVDPFRLNRTQTLLIKAISGKVTCVVDEKTDVITLKVTDQDPLICANMANVVRKELQDFIIEYRTKKAKTELERMQKLQKDAYATYMSKQREYNSTADANLDVVLQSYRSQQTSLENDMQLAYNVYSQLSQQVQLARAKVLERTPAFTTIQNATVPIQPAGPRRTFIVLGFMVVAFILTTVYIIIRK